MIIKNGEILAIDHIAHDNTLSGNGTSAKPVGLSQSTKDLIDSKVKKTDFETYKSSAANQISNINTKITTDESNFESYKSSAHNEIARVDASIAAVSAAKVDKTTFTQYQTDVANSFTAVNKRIDDVDAAKVDNTTFDNFKGSANGELTGIKQSITDLDNAKQNKGYYVSASDFNSYKSSAHNEIARVDGRIDATNTNLSNNYYDRTTIDKKFADFGGYKFRDPDPNNNNQPILNQGEEPDPKAIYLTQPEGATQYLQWIWDEEITEENKWKCIGDTTMDLSDYAKTVDVVASANNNVQAVKGWADGKFETISDFNTVIAGYYTKGQVDTELGNIAQEFVDTSAWANDTFATKTDLAGDKVELEGKINDLDTKAETELSAVSGKIIGELNSSKQALDERIDSVIVDLGNVSSTLEDEITDVDNKVDTLTDELHDDYYTSNQIDTILAASGEYYTVDEVNEKLEDYAKSTDLDPIKDDINSISAKFDNYYTETDADGKFVTKTTFNALDEFVNAINDDLDTVSGDVVTLSGKVNNLHNTVIEDSDTVKAFPVTGEDGTISYTLSAHDGKQADYLWKPTVNAAGDISWELALTGDTPDPANIKGSDGDDGKTPVLSANGTHIEWKYTDESIWNDLGDFKGEPGADGKDGKDGKDGINGTSAFVRINPNTNYWEISNDNKTWTSTDVSATGPQGEEGDEGEPGFSPTVDAVAITDGEKTGTEITFTYKDEQGQTQTTVYSAWNGVNGEGATVHFNGIDGIKITSVDTTHFNVGLSADYKTQVEAVSGKLDASDLVGYATEAWVGEQGYLKQNDIAGKADKTDLQYVSAGVDYVSAHIPSLNGYATEQYVQGASAEVTAWVNEQGYLKSVPSEYITETELSTELSDYLTKLSADDLYQPKGNYLTTVTTTGSISGGGVNNDTIGLLTSAENALKNVANKANTADVYSKIDADSRYVATAYIDSTSLSGDGKTVNTKLGIDSSNFYELDTVGNYLTSQTSDQKTLIGTTPALDNAVQKVIDEADTWDTVSAKSVVTINKATNEIKINNNANSAMSATIYDEGNTSEPTLIPQRLIVGTSSGDFITYVNGGKCEGQGTLFFWLESMQPWVPVNN